MISFEQFCKVKTLQQMSLSSMQIAESCQVNEKTVRKYLKMTKYSARKLAPRTSKLDPFTTQIISDLERHPYSAVQIFDRIRQNGYEGRLTIVKDYVRKMRPPPQQAFLTLSFGPGECAQVDWGSAGTIAVGNAKRRLSFFVMVLCYSRMLYVRFTIGESTEHWLQCHRDAFEFFGGVPARVMVDNCKTAVLQHRRGQVPVLNPRYEQFAEHYRFDIVPCNVKAPNEKGRVENAVGYVKKNFLTGIDRSSLSVIQFAADQWRDQTANKRIHGTTQKTPIELFEIEKQHLIPLPKSPFDCSVKKCPVLSNSQFRVRVDSNKYSVPAQYASRRDLSVQLYPELLRIFLDNELIAEHQRRYTRNMDYELPDHPRALLQQRRKARDQILMRRFLAMGPEAEVYYHGLSQRRLNPTHHVRNIVAMIDSYDVNLIRRAMADAATFEAYHSECVINLIEQRQRHVIPQPSPLHLTRNQDLLEIDQPEANLGIYSPETNNKEE